MIFKKIFRLFIHFIFPVKRAQYKELKKFSQNIKNKKILEIGTGKHDVEIFFDKSNIFLKSDSNPEYGHRMIDVTEMNYKNEFDMIICLNVLEHVFNYEKAIENMYNALNLKGVLFLSVPVFYPLHDEPQDYWRFTEHSLRKIFLIFPEVSIKKDGIRQFPYNYSLICRKSIK